MKIFFIISKASILSSFRSSTGDKRTRTADIRHRVSHRLLDFIDLFYHRGL